MTKPLFKDATVTGCTSLDEYAWMAIASECNCNGVSVTLFHRTHVGGEYADAPAEPGEVLILSDDWGAAITTAARTLRESTGMGVCSRCTNVLAPDGLIDRDPAAVLRAMEDPDTNRKLNIGDAVVVPSDFCPGCLERVAEMTGVIVGYEDSSLLEDKGLLGPYYTVCVDHVHNSDGRLVYDESELIA